MTLGLFLGRINVPTMGQALCKVSGLPSHVLAHDEHSEKRHGDVASMAECLLNMYEVLGSILDHIHRA